MNDKKTIQIIFSSRQMEMIGMLKEETGVDTIKGVLTMALSDMFKSYFPAYKSGVIANAEKNLKRNIAMKKQKKDMEKTAEAEEQKEEQMLICKNNFFGEVTEDGMCKYISYGMRKEEDTVEEIPLESCSVDLAESNLFIPSRDAVLKNRKDLQKKFSK